MKRPAKPRPQFVLPIALSFSIEPIKKSDLVTFTFRERHAPGDRDFKLRRRNTIEALQKSVPGIKMLKAGPLEYAYSVVLTRAEAADMIISEMLYTSSIGPVTFNDFWMAVTKTIIPPLITTDPPKRPS